MIDSDRKAREEMHSDHYAQQFIDSKQIKRVERLLERIILPPRARVLDAGCGTGILSSLVSPRCAAYTGVDFSHAMLQRARLRVSEKGLENCEFICDDLITHMNARQEVYDAIFMLDISEHVPDPEWARIVAASRYALKPDGRVYLHTPNLEFVVERLKQVGLMRQFSEHVAVRDAAGNVKFFLDAGFAAVDCTVLPHYNVLRLLHPLSKLPVVGGCFSARLWIVAVR